MSSLFNQYSYILFSLAAFAAVLVLLRLARVKPAVTVAAGLLVLALTAAGWLVLRPGASDVDSLSAAEAMINSGKPTFVEFFSNYCAGCLSARTAVDELVAQMSERYGDSYNILRIDIHTEFGRALRERYGFSFTPEFVLFDATGTEVWRSHVPPTLLEIDMVRSSAPAESAG